MSDTSMSGLKMGDIYIYTYMIHVIYTVYIYIYGALSLRQIYIQILLITCTIFPLYPMLTLLILISPDSYHQ